MVGYQLEHKICNKIDISDFLFVNNPTQDAIYDFIIMDEVNGSTTVSIDTDGQGAGEAVEIAVFRDVTGLTMDDFIIDTGTFG